MSDRRLITIYWDVVNLVHYDSSGNTLNARDYPFMFYKENPLVNVLLVTDSSLTPLDTLNELPSAHVFSIAVDDDFDHSSTVLCKTVDADVNVPGEWTLDSNGNANVADGEFSFTLDANTSEFQTAISDDQKKDGWLEILVLDSVGGNVVAAFQIPFILRNIIDPEGASVTGLADSTFVMGQASIGNAASSVTVTGLGLASAPAQVILTVQMPDSSGLLLLASPRTDSYTTDGFIADLSGLTDSANYKLNYLIKLS